MSEEKGYIRVRIQNDGHLSRQTKVTDVETGREFYGVTKVVIGDINDPAAHPFPYAEITIADAIFDVIADAQIKHICPCCGRDVVLEANEHH